MYKNEAKLLTLIHKTVVGQNVGIVYECPNKLVGHLSFVAIFAYFTHYSES